MQPQEFLLHGLQNEGHIEKGGSEIEKYSCNYFKGGIGLLTAAHVGVRGVKNGQKRAYVINGRPLMVVLVQFLFQNKIWNEICSKFQD